MKIIKAIFIASLLLLSTDMALSKEEIARAYLIDGVNGTRSGPIRNTNDKEKLNADKKYLIEHAQSNERSSGIVKPGDEYWTDLPADSIFTNKED